MLVSLVFYMKNSCLCVGVLNCSAMSHSLWPHGLHSLWNSLGQNTGVGSLSLLQGIFPTQVSHIAGKFFTSWTSREAQKWCQSTLKSESESCSVMSDFATPLTVAHQAPLSMGFSRQEYWSGLPFPSLWGLLNPGIEPTSPALAGGFFTTKPTGKPHTLPTINLSCVLYPFSVQFGSVAQSCLTLCNPMDCNLPGASVPGTLQARILEWVAISFSMGSSGPRDRTRVSWIASRFFTIWAAREAPSYPATS